MAEDDYIKERSHIYTFCWPRPDLDPLGRRNLARHAGGLVLAGRVVATGQVNAGPGPVGAAALAAENVDGGGVGVDGAGDAVHGQALDGDVVGGLAGGPAVLVVLLDDDALLVDVGELDVRVGDVGHVAGLVDDGLDADAVVRVGDGRVGDGHVGDGVVVAAADGADGDTVAAGAGRAAELEVLARVDGQAVVLVLDVGAADVDAVGLVHVEGVGVVAAVGVAVRVVDVDVLEERVGGLHGDGLHGGVLDVEAGDGRVLELVGVQELGLLLAAVGALAVPPARAVTVNEAALGHVDGDLLTLDADQGALPLLVLEGGGALEGDGGAVVDLGQVEGLTGGHLDVLDDNLGAAGDALGGLRGGGDGARRVLLGQRGSRGSRDEGAHGGEAEKLEGTHIEMLG